MWLRPELSGRCHTTGRSKQPYNHSQHPYPTQIHECAWRSSGRGVIPRANVLFAHLLLQRIMAIWLASGEANWHSWAEKGVRSLTVNVYYETETKATPVIAHMGTFMSSQIFFHCERKWTTGDSSAAFLLASSCAFINIVDLENEQYFLTPLVILQPQWKSWARAASSTASHWWAYKRAFAPPSQVQPPILSSVSQNSHCPRTFCQWETPNSNCSY